MNHLEILSSLDRLGGLVVRRAVVGDAVEAETDAGNTPQWWSTQVQAALDAPELIVTGFARLYQEVPPVYRVVARITERG